MQKRQKIRSRALLNACRELDCQHCGADDGTIVAAHTNWGGGKGMGQKADDNLVASLCFTCHGMIDQGSKLSREQRQEIWNDAHKKTVEKLVKIGLWPENIPIP